MTSFQNKKEPAKRPATAKRRAVKDVKTLEERSRSRSKRKHEQMYAKNDLFNKPLISDEQKRE